MRFKTRGRCGAVLAPAGQSVRTGPRWQLLVRARMAAMCGSQVTRDRAPLSYFRRTAAPSSQHGCRRVRTYTYIYLEGGGCSVGRL